MSNRITVLIAATLLLAACSSVPQRKVETVPAPTPAPAPAAVAPHGSGGYLAGDGPGDNIPVDLDAIPDAVPKIEPLNRYANRPYVALGKTYIPMTIPGIYKERGIASWYGRKFNGQRTSSGEIYDMYAMTAAHPTLPLPSYARVTNLANQKSVIVRINDRGPFLHDRLIDLSYTAAYKLGIIGTGSAEVEVESLAPNVAINTIAQSTVQSKPLESAMPASGVAAAAVAATSPEISVPASAVVAVPATLDNEPPVSAVVAAPVAASANNPPASAVVAAPAAVATLDSTTTNVYLQLGAFKSQDGAESFLEKMRSELGDTGKQIKLSAKDGLIRVHIGPYASQSEARSSAESMESKLGFKPMLNLP